MVTTKSSQPGKKCQDGDSLNYSPRVIFMLTLFFTVALVHIVALMSPGPDFFVSQTAVSRSRKEAMMGVLGITCGVMVWLAWHCSACI
jgi:hypothetical protein